MTPERTIVTEDDIRARLAARTEETGIDAERHRLRRATALSSSFTVSDLADLGADDVATFLALDTEPVGRTPGERWRLRSAVRDEVLRDLAAAGDLAAAVDTPLPADPTDGARRAAERMLAADFNPTRLGPVELGGATVACRWLAPVVPEIAAAEAEIRRLRARSQLLESRRAAQIGFVGRTGELDLLHTSRRSGGPRYVVVSGMGGVGKTTLLARFAVECVERWAIPCATVTFEGIDTAPDAPLHMLANVARQLALQTDDLGVDKATDRFVEAATKTQAAELREASEMATSRATAVNRKRSWRLADQNILIGRFIDLVEATHPQGAVIVIDTFEIVQDVSPSYADRFVQILRSIVERSRSIAVVVAGRGRVEVDLAVHLALGALTEEEGKELLRRRSQGIRVPEPFLGEVLDRSGLHPLTLRLLADLLVQEGEERLAQPQVQGAILADVAEIEVQGILYRRILDHLPDPDLRRLASPGLVVRRVTPDVVRHVLAGPCGLGPIDDDRARELVAELAQIGWLVHQVDEQTLVHRADLRAVMIPLLRRDAPDTVLEIHEAAADWYGRADRPEAVRELLYHLLALGVGSHDLDVVWDPAAGAGLEEETDLPPSSLVYLADKQGRTVPPALRAAADDEAWARQAVRLAVGYLNDGQPAQAAAVLAERDSRTVRDATTGLRVEALARAGRLEEAMDLVERSLGWAAASAMPDTYRELALLGARVAESMGDISAASRLLEELRTSTGESVALAGLTAGVALLRIDRHHGLADLDVAALREDVLAEALAMGDELDEHPALLSDLASELGKHAPELVARAARADALSFESASAYDDDEDLLTATEMGQALYDDITDEDGIIDDVAWSVDADGDGIVESIRSDADESPF
ncbi:MAG TPA: AAA family ATPase [Iamia sp.]